MENPTSRGDSAFPPDVPLSRNRDFLRLWTGQATSSLGVSISSFAYPLLVLSITGSPTLAGLVTSVLTGTTFVLRVPAGLVSDFLNRKALMILCDAGRFVALSSIVLAAFVGTPTVAHIAIVSAVEATLGVLFAPAEGVVLRSIVAPGQRRDAVTRNEARSQLAGLIGPPIGGVLFGWSRALPFVADALSYLVSLVTVATIRTRVPAAATRPPARRLWQELTHGIRWLMRDPFLRGTTMWLAASGTIFTSIGLVTLVLARDLGASPAAIGVMSGITAAGGLLGAVAAPWIVSRWAARAILVTFAWVSTAAVFSLLVATSTAAIGLIGAVAFLLVPSVNAVVFGHVAETAPDDVHGRVVSATVQVTTVLHPLGPTLVGVILDEFGSATTLVVYGCGALVLAAVMALSAIGRQPTAQVPTDGR